MAVLREIEALPECRTSDRDSARYRTPFIWQHDFQELSTWKIGTEFSESQLRAVYRYLLLKEAVGVEFSSYNGLFLTDKSRRFLSSLAPVFLSEHGSGQRKSRNY